MNIKDSKRLMSLAMKANAPYILVGHSGIGKTQITEQVAKEVFPNHKFVTVMASQCDVGDFIGIPDITTLEAVDAKGKKKVSKVTSWARPEWMPHEPCVIFLDELNNARPDVESAMLQLVLERRIHTHSLHPDSYICAAINPATAEYTTANIMSSALVKRFMVIPFEPLASEFIEWAGNKGNFDAKLLAFLKFRPDLSGAEKPLDTLIKMEPCPRVWNMVNNVYQVINKEGNASDRELVKDLLSTTVGIAATGVFLSWLDTQDKPVTLADIVKSPKKAIERYQGFHEAARNDLIASTHEEIINGFNKLVGEAVQYVDYKTSILEYERNSDPKLVKDALKEFNDILSKGKLPAEITDKLDAIIQFVSKLQADAVYQISVAIITNKPFEESDNKDEAYQKAQFKRINTYNTLVFYMMREDLVTKKGHKGFGQLYRDSVAEVNKHKAVEEKQASK